MKKLPKMYCGDIVKKINNNSDYCVVTDDVLDVNINNSVREELDNLFDGMGYTSKIGVLIKTKDMIYNTKIVARTSNNIITKDNDIIPIDNIIFLQRKNP